jgi:hypothetical protein
MKKEKRNTNRSGFTDFIIIDSFMFDSAITAKTETSSIANPITLLHTNAATIYIITSIIFVLGSRL